MKPEIILTTLMVVALPACQPPTPAAPPATDPHAGHNHDHSSHSHADKPITKSSHLPKSPSTAKPGVKPYPLATCIVTNEPLGEWDEEATTCLPPN